MQSDGNSFWRDVVLDSFGMAYKSKDSILDQQYNELISWYFNNKDFEFYKWLKKRHI